MCHYYLKPFNSNTCSSILFAICKSRPYVSNKPGCCCWNTRNRITKNNNSFHNKRTFSTKKRKKKTATMKTNSQKIKDAINAQRIKNKETHNNNDIMMTTKHHNQEGSRKYQQQKRLPFQPNRITSSVSDQQKNNSVSILNTFLLLGIFPLLGAGSLLYLNDEMRDDFIQQYGNDYMKKKLGIDQTV